MCSINVRPFTVLPTPACREGRIPLLIKFKEELSARTTSRCFVKESPAVPLTNKPSLWNAAVAIWTSQFETFEFAMLGVLLRALSGVYLKWKANAIYNCHCSSTRDVTLPSRNTLSNLENLLSHFRPCLNIARDKFLEKLHLFSQRLIHINVISNKIMIQTLFSLLFLIFFTSIKEKKRNH